MSSTSKHFRLAIAAVSAIGLYASAHLIQVHLEVALLGSAQSGLCNLGSRINCTGSATSDFATIFGIPIAALGLGFYVAAIAVALFGPAVAGDAADDETHPIRDGGGLLTTLFGLGSAYSLFLLVISITVVKSVCPWCFATYLVNFVGLFLAVKWYGACPRVSIVRQLKALGATLMAKPTLVFLPLFVGAAAGTTAWEYSVIANQPQAELQSDVEVDADSLLAETAPSLGSPTAEVHIVEFSDFQCPYCSRLAATMREIEEHYGDQVYIQFRQFPLSFHEHADLAARGGVCAAEQGKFWEYHDIVFENQRRIGNNLLGLAEQAGLDVNALEDCMDSPFARTRVDEDIAAGEAVGVNGTPYFFINGVMYAGAYPFDEIARVIDAHLEDGE